MTNKYSLTFKKIIRLMLIIIGTFSLLYGTAKLFPILAPFIIAFLLSSLMEPIIRFLMKRARFPRKAAAPVVLILVLSVLGFLITISVLKLISEIRSLIPLIPSFFNSLSGNLTTLFSNLVTKGTIAYDWLPTEITANLGSIVSNISSSLVRLANSIVKSAFSIGLSIPEAVIFIIATIVATYFFSSDRERISSFVSSQLPESWIKRFYRLKNDIFFAIFGYFRALLILMFITFSELFIGFTIIGVDYPLLLAFIVSVIDIFPILGTGTVLIPWGVYMLIIGDIPMGVSILVIYVVVLIVRQIIEPKVVGQQIGVHPLATLMAMFIGLKVFGMLGFILGPITLLVLKSIFNAAFKNRTIKDFLKRPSSI